MSRRAKTDGENWLTGAVSQVGRSKPAPTPSVYFSGRPRIPQHLDRLARAAYKRACHILEHRRTLTEGDFFAIAVLAEAYSRWCQAKSELGSEYLIRTAVKDKEGNVIQVIKTNPLVRVVENAESKVLALSKSLGLTPSDRDRVKQTKFAGDIEVVPGSMAALHPELLNTPEPEPLYLPPANEEEEDQDDPE